MNWYSRTVLARPISPDRIDWDEVRRSAGQGHTMAEVASEMGLRYQNFVEALHDMFRDPNAPQAWQEVEDQFRENKRRRLSEDNKRRMETLVNTFKQRRVIDWPIVARLLLRGRSMRSIAQELGISVVTLQKRVWKELVPKQSPFYDKDVAKLLSPPLAADYDALRKRLSSDPELLEAFERQSKSTQQWIVRLPESKQDEAIRDLKGSKPTRTRRPSGRPYPLGPASAPAPALAPAPAIGRPSDYKSDIARFLGKRKKTMPLPSVPAVPSDPMRSINWPAVSKMILKGMSIEAIARKLYMPFEALSGRIRRDLINEKSPIYNPYVALFLEKNKDLLAAAEPAAE